MPHSAAREDGERNAELGSIRRTPEGWRVHNGQELPDLLSAMVLADLLVAEEQRGDTRPTTPPKTPDEATEVERLRVTVNQLEHALHTRVVVEQAIGVLAERHQLRPREAFQRLRSAARSRGRKVADLARQVITSSTDPSISLPDELAAQGSTPPS
ncbi:ANTAR domain-containing protein [Halostreptopolyspora alba]|uniref:ANTAR domain-containing protein n=1 Tax=Halostreptopolyspora alba TaxID=2487137 RepID=A0A3N0ECL7_9ACTN|nr:ANTAR domain-containing protein [Nocardiopsaceae bacterium YIM 96095]